MEILTHLVDCTKSKKFTIIPIGDVHLGNIACDEALLRTVINRVKNEENTYWIGMGDYCDFINKTDPRFEVGVLADWFELKDLNDITRRQKERFLELFAPIGKKCLALVKGNHEQAILKHYERDIYRELVTELKERAGIDEAVRIGAGYYAWLNLRLMSTQTKRFSIMFNLHHGFTGGTLKGAKALSMERWLWNHECDVCIMGHSHNKDIMTAAVQRIDKKGHPYIHERIGVYSGSFFRTNVEGVETYAERRGLYPLPLGGCEIRVDITNAERVCDKMIEAVIKN